MAFGLGREVSFSVLSKWIVDARCVTVDGFAGHDRWRKQMYLSIVVSDEHEADWVLALCREYATVSSSELGYINDGPLVVLLDVAGANIERDIDSPLAGALGQLGMRCVWTSYRPEVFVPAQ